MKSRLRMVKEEEGGLSEKRREGRKRISWVMVMIMIVVFMRRIQPYTIKIMRHVIQVGGFRAPYNSPSQSRPSFELRAAPCIPTHRNATEPTDCSPKYEEAPPETVPRDHTRRGVQWYPPESSPELNSVQEGVQVLRHQHAREVEQHSQKYSYVNVSKIQVMPNTNEILGARAKVLRG